MVERTLDDDFVDVTADVQEYKKGKVYDWECGQGHGVGYGEQFGTCPACGRTLVDKRRGEREPPEDTTEQATLGDW